MDLPLIWAGIIAMAVLTYALLDGFDLGVGLFFPTLSDAEKDAAIETIAPIWDGNETWLVLGGGGLYATFPLAYATILPALYPLIIAMLLALVFRGVSMEYRHKTKRIKKFWDLGFFVGSLLAALSQGIMLGAFIQGINIVDRSYAGGWFDWFTPFSLLCGCAIVLGYALLGACWLVMKTRGAMNNRMRAVLPALVIAVFFAIVALSSWTPFLDERLTQRWFSWPNMLVLAPMPVLITLVSFLLWRTARDNAIVGGNDSRPFYYAQALFVVTFLGFGISTYPYIVPHSLTIWEAAAPDSSLSFLLAGTAVLLPVIVGYTAHSYWVFRGKVISDAPETEATGDAMQGQTE